MTDLIFLKQAIQLAKDHSRTGQGGPFGSVVVRGDEIVGQGWNQVVEGKDPTAHAEILAIRDAARRLGTHVLEDCIIYCSCEPCPMCLSAIYWARIPRVVFAAEGRDAASAGFDDAFIARELSLDWGERALDNSRALRDEGAEVFADWAENPDRQEY